MPESSKDTVILITTSYQALQRARKLDKFTFKSDCIAALIFASFYIEANLNQIISFTNSHEELKAFVGYDHPGMQDKLIWLYSKFNPNSGTLENKLSKRQKKNMINHILKSLKGFDEIYSFRNKLAHGEIDSTFFNLDRIEDLRLKSKLIVDELYKKAKDNGYDIPRNKSYFDVY